MTAHGVTNAMLDELLAKANSSSPQFKGEDFHHALPVLFKMCCSDDKTFTSNLHAISNILDGAKSLGIVYTLVEERVALDPSCSLSVGLMKTAASLCNYLTIVLIRKRNLLHLEPKTTPAPKPEKKTQECWCVVNGRPAPNASTGHRCGFQDGKMGITWAIDGQIETHPVPCKDKGKCHTKNCIFDH